MTKIRIEQLANGYYQAYDYSSRLSGLYNADGTYRSGDLRLSRAYVLALIAQG